MIRIHAFKKRAILGVTFMAIVGGQSAQGSNLAGEQIIATFGGVITAGTIANDPGAGQTTYLNNASTAAYNINNGTASSNMNWGTYAAGSTTFLTDSILVFVGNTISSTPSTPFNIGSLTFDNGTSDLTSLIFGVSMNFYSGSVSPATLLGTDTIVITTTNNVFNVPGGLTNGDDDYINVCGTFSSICGTSIEAVESSEGGQGVVVNLFGTIVGDPMLDLTSVTLGGGQNPTQNGFLGTDSAVGATAPEPATWGMTGRMLVLGCLLLRRRLANG